MAWPKVDLPDAAGPSMAICKRDLFMDSTFLNVRAGAHRIHFRLRQLPPLASRQFAQSNRTYADSAELYHRVTHRSHHKTNLALFPFMNRNAQGRGTFS